MALTGSNKLCLQQKNGLVLSKSTSNKKQDKQFAAGLSKSAGMNAGKGGKKATFSRVFLAFSTDIMTKSSFGEIRNFYISMVLFWQKSIKENSVMDEKYKKLCNYLAASSQNVIRSA